MVYIANLQRNIEKTKKKEFFEDSEKKVLPNFKQHTVSCLSKAVACKERQYDFCLTVYCFRMAFCKVSTVSGHKEKKSRLLDAAFQPPKCRTHVLGWSDEISIKLLVF